MLEEKGCVFTHNRGVCAICPLSICASILAFVLLSSFEKYPKNAMSLKKSICSYINIYICIILQYENEGLCHIFEFSKLAYMLYDKILISK